MRLGPVIHRGPVHGYCSGAWPTSAATAADPPGAPDPRPLAAGNLLHPVGTATEPDNCCLTLTWVGVYVPRMSPYRRRTPSEAADELHGLAGALETYRAEADRSSAKLGKKVASCIRAGATWAEVGERMGMSKQGARSHWLTYVEEVSDRE